MLIVVERRETFHYYYPMGVHPPGDLTVTAELKGQLDNYSLFYTGLKEYTSAVSDAANGANTLKLNMDTLYTNVGTLKTSVGELNDGVKTLYDGTATLKNGTGEFVKETDGIWFFDCSS